jgi:hypothetical protein
MSLPTYPEFLLVTWENILGESFVQVALALKTGRAETVYELLPLMQGAADEIPANVLRRHLPDDFTIDTRVSQMPKRVPTLILANRLSTLPLRGRERAVRVGDI